MKLYKLDSKQKLRVVEIYADGDKVIQLHGLVDGSLVRNESVCVGKNIGKANETTSEAQAEFEAKSKIKKKLDEGYAISIEAAESAEILLPMLAKDYKKESKKVTFPCFVQPKLDGMRCLAVVKNGDVKLISRKGIEITTMSHIVEQLKEITSVEDNFVLDGEVYNMGLGSFQEQMKAIKKETEISKQINFNIYDIVEDKPYSYRFDFLFRRFSNLSLRYNVQLLPTTYVMSEDDIKTCHKYFIKEGYEGTMVRHGSEGYQIDKRSSSLLKYKDFIDIAVTIVDVQPSEKRPDQAQFICEFNGTTFGCGIKFSHEERKEILINKDDYIGKTAEIRFFEYTDDGTPRFPVCYGIRLDK